MPQQRISKDSITVEGACICGAVCTQAMAAHNSGGLVIVQVERVVERGCIPARSVHVPGAFVDKVRQLVHGIPQFRLQQGALHACPMF